MKCASCGSDVLDIDVKCATCGAALAASGAHRMIGQLVLGQYELVDVIGQGGMSVVFKARHKMTDQEVALKILPPELAANSQVKSRFLEEAKALAALDHPNIVHLYNFGQENGSFVLAMQFVEGRTWERLVLEKTKLDWRASCRIAVDVLKALEYAHGRGVIHRDMKPSNVLVRSHDSLATVMDFGIAKMAQSTRLTATGQTMGTVRYMSPEQVRGQEVDPRTDIYSLGASLYESLVGDTPFDGQTHFEIMTKHLSEVAKRPSSLGVDVPPEVEDALVRSLAKRATDRFDNARDMRKVLEGALRAGDVGLVETQRLQREMLGEPRAAAPTPAVLPTRPATAAELADQLEPSKSGQRTTVQGSRRARWPWIVAALLVVGGGAAAFVLRTGGESPSSHVKPSAAEIVFVPGADAGEAEGKAAYEAALAKFTAQLSEKLHGVKAERPVDRIVLVPHAELCDRKYYIKVPPPDDCANLLASVSAAAPRTLLVTADQGQLAAAMAEGVATAVCLFQAFSLAPDQHDSKEIVGNAICDFVKEQQQAPGRLTSPR
ncbi:MAG TPA: serine/threonine-protein kinase [Kofleriaceae bacterium]|nr:serine/threonine-protein kinase [Kofleriaceae bacterium]